MTALEAIKEARRKATAEAQAKADRIRKAKVATGETVTGANSENNILSGLTGTNINPLLLIGAGLLIYFLFKNKKP